MEREKRDPTLELGDLNYAEALREQLRWNPAGTILEEKDWLLALGGDSFPIGFLNAALPLRPEASTHPRERIEEIGRFFGEQGRGFTVHVPSHYPSELAEACEGLGLQTFGDTPGMVLDAPVKESPRTDGSELRIVSDAAGARDFAEVSTRSYATMGLPEHVSSGIFSAPERILQPHIVSIVAYRDHAAVSAAMAILSHGIAGVYWVGTVEAARGRGLGDACTRAVSNAAFDRGAGCVVLQASAEGEPIYLRMGYREVTRYVWYATLKPLGS